MSAVNQGHGAEGGLWQPRFFDRALRTVKEYNEKVEYLHLNPVRAGLVSRPEDWSRGAGSSYHEYAGMSADQQKRKLWFDRRPRPNALRSARTNLIPPSRGLKDADRSGLAVIRPTEQKRRSTYPRTPYLGSLNARGTSTGRLAVN
jgi:hypothetical protein